MQSATLTQARQAFREALELGGRSERTIDYYEFFLESPQEWLKANGGPLNVGEAAHWS